MSLDTAKNVRYAITLVVIIAAATIGFSLGRASVSKSSTSCYTFSRSYPQGLMDGFKGKVCATSAPVQAIAKNYNQCVKAQGAPMCGYALLQYLASSGAYPDDAAKVELLVLQAAGGH